MGVVAQQYRAEPADVEGIIEQNQLAFVPESPGLSSVDCPQSQTTVDDRVESEGLFSQAKTTDMILEYYLDRW